MMSRPRGSAKQERNLNFHHKGIIHEEFNVPPFNRQPAPRRSSKTLDGSYQVTIFGKASVGKTSICRYNQTSAFTNFYQPTTETSFSKILDLKEKRYCIKTTDTCGFELSEELRDSFIFARSAFIVVYSIDDIESFEIASNILEQLEDMVDFFEVPVLLLGNKSDLEEARQVTFDQGRNLLQGKCGKFYETSIKDKYSDKSSPEEFKEVLEMILQARADNGML